MSTISMEMVSSPGYDENFICVGFLFLLMFSSIEKKSLFICSAFVGFFYIFHFFYVLHLYWIVASKCLKVKIREEMLSLMKNSIFICFSLIGLFMLLASQSDAHTIAPHRDPNPSHPLPNPIHL